MRSWRGRRWIWALFLALAACGTKGQEKKDGLSGHNSPYTFHRSIATTLIRTHQYEKAVAHIRRMLASSPDEPEPHYLLARAFLGMELSWEAQQEIERSLKLGKDYAPAHALKGVILDGKKKHKSAEKSHRRAIKLAPKVPNYHNNLGFCLFLQKRYEEATKAYRKGLAIRPTSRRIHNNLAFALARLGRTEQALKHFKLAGEEAEAHNNMGLAHEMAGELDRAYHYYFLAVEGARLAEARVNLTRVCRKLGRPLPRLLHDQHGPSSMPAGPPEGKP
jgi:Flp pilus assembly protein TadD